MMLCNPCLSKYTNNESCFKSYGTCECCNRVDVCNDIPSSQLEHKVVKRDTIKDKEDRFLNGIENSEMKESLEKETV